MNDLTMAMILMEQMVVLVVDDLDGNTVVGNTVAGLWSCCCSFFRFYNSTVIPYVSNILIMQKAYDVFMPK